jgi:cobalt/nickel transport system ATP-binding protein
VAGEPAVLVEGLTFAYPGRPPALSQLRFQVEPGQSVGLVGPNGAGKTTLFLCLAGVLPVAPGQARVAGLDPGVPAERKRLPQNIGLVFQNSDDQLFCATVGDDVAFGPLNLGLPAQEVHRRVTDALARVGLAGFEERVPHHLSGGEKRRVALAGVLAMKPSILLLDEPSAFLDPRGRRELLAVLQQLPGTRLIASHNLDFILESCDNVLLLDQGILEAFGPAREILSNQNLLESHGLEVPWQLR